MYAGSLNSNDIFRKIVSIGFEFETHDISKFSLHDNGYSLINSNNVIRTINYKLENNLSEKIDDNNYVFYIEDDIKINKHNNTKNYNLIKDFKLTSQTNTKNSQSSHSSHSKNSRNSNSKSSTQNTEYDNNESFIEYIDENNTDDKDVEFKITNDVGNGEFNDMLSRCQKSSKSNNELYIFRTKDKEYSLKFFEITDCQTMSGVEYVSTYYNPKSDSNIIIEYFIDASNRIIEHLSDLVKIKGQLFIQVKNNFQKMGNLDYRFLFHKPNTNLYYLHTNDDKYTLRSSSLNSSVIVPQMTFGCYAKDLINIMKEILNMTGLNYNIGKLNVKIIQGEYENLLHVEKITDQFINDYKQQTNHHLDETFKTYLFMILYKLDIYINLYYHTDRTDYFKSFISFLSRHSNHTFYKLMIDWLKNNQHITHKKAVEQIHILLSGLNGISMLYRINIKKTKDLKKKIEHIKISNEKYGDPYESIMSYFDFFEEPLTDESVDENEQDWFDKDWLMYNEIEAFTTKMDIKNDILLTENRLFNIEIKSYIKNESNVKVRSRELRIIDLKNFIIDMSRKSKINNTQKYKKLLNTKTRKNRKSDN
jgi:hypothetical protein